jgi:hypothetical protein
VCRNGGKNRRFPFHHALACSISPKFNLRAKLSHAMVRVGGELAHIQENSALPMGARQIIAQIFRPCDIGHRGRPIHCELLLCRTDRYRRVLDEVRMDQPSEFNRSKVRTHRLQSVTGGVVGELVKAVLMATGGLTAMAALVVLASFAISAWL